MANILRTAVNAFAPQYLNTGTEIAPSWTNISEHILTWNTEGTRESIEVSNWSSQDKIYQAGARTIKASMTIAYRVIDTVVSVFNGAFLAGTDVGLKFPFGDKTLIAYFTISGFKQNGNQGELAKFDITLEMSGTPSIT